MSLTLKITSLLLAVFGLFFAVQLLIQQAVLRPSFERLERAEAMTDVERCRDAINQEVAHLSTLCNDWACWDDSYRFVQDGNQDFIDDTLTGDVLDVANLELLMYCDLEGNVVWKESKQSDSAADAIFAQLPSNLSDPDHFLLQSRSSMTEKSGVLLVENSPLLIVSRPILTSAAEGPATGTLIMARLLDDDSIAVLQEQTHVKFAALSPTSINDTLDGTEQSALQEHDQPLLRIVDTDTLEAFASLPYLNSDSSLILEAFVPRRISREGNAALTFAMLTFLAASLVTYFVAQVSIRHIVLRPLRELTAHAVSTASTHDWSARINTARSDELGRLSDEFDHMVSALGAYHAAANAMAYDSGRAELASGAVHDIGNAINSAGVSAHLVSDLVRHSAAPKLGKVSVLVDELATDPSLLTSDPTILAKLNVYTAELADHLLQERDDSLQELESLAGHILRVTQVIQTQMSTISASVHNSQTSLSDMADMAIAVSRPLFQQEGLELSTSIAECGPVWLDRSKILQVLTSLLPLAAKAVASNPVDARLIQLTIAPIGQELLRFEVINNSIDEVPTDLTSIFRQQQDDTGSIAGSDLHHCALAALSIGGTLSAAQNKSGNGITFTLDVPLVLASATGEPSQGRQIA